MPPKLRHVGHLLCLPEYFEEIQAEIEQDEFRCLNLNVSVPAGQSSKKDLLPVLIWIHGKLFCTTQLGL
jgi:carboxylesterase type B